jgi:hypothetical protein
VAASRGLVAGGCALAFVAAFGAWAERQLLDTEQWVQTSDELLRDEAVRDETAAYLATQVVGRSGLRPQAERLARSALESPSFERLWEETSRRTHTRFVELVRDDGGTAGELVLDLHPLVVALAQRAGVPPSLVPRDSGRLRVLRRDQVDTARGVVEVLETVALWSLVLAVGAFAAALALARGRRAGVLAGAGAGLVVVGLLVLAVRELGGTIVADEVAERGGAEAAAEASWSIATSLLRDVGIAVAATGAVAALVGLLSRR